MDEVYGNYLHHTSRLKDNKSLYQQEEEKLVRLKEVKSKLKLKLGPMEEKLKEVEEKVDEILDDEKEVGKVVLENDRFLEKMRIACFHDYPI